MPSVCTFISFQTSLSRYQTAYSTICKMSQKYRFCCSWIFKGGENSLVLSFDVRFYMPVSKYMFCIGKQDIARVHQRLICICDNQSRVNNESSLDEGVPLNGSSKCTWYLYLSNLRSVAYQSHILLVRTSHRFELHLLFFLDTAIVEQWSG